MANEFTARNGLIAQKDSVVTGSLIVTSGITGSLLGTASYASTYAAVFPYTGSAIISGSLGVTGSILVSGSVQVGLGTSTNNAIQFGTAGLGISGTSANRLDFNTAGVSRIAILSNGTVVMGSDTTNIVGNNLIDYSTNATSIKLTPTTITLATGTGTPGTGVSYFRLHSNGNLILQNGGTFTDAGYRLDVQGTSRFNGNSIITGSLNITGSISQNGGALALQDGTILYYSIKWFTPSSTVSTSGTTVTSIGTQFLSTMVGSKLTISGESRIITAFTSTTQVTVNSAYSTNYSGIAAGSWGVYSKGLELASASGLPTVYSGFQNGGAPAGSIVFTYSAGYVTNDFGYKLNNNRAAFIFNLQGNNDYSINWSSTNVYSGTGDLGLRRNTAGTLEIFDGVTATGLLANRRDLLARNVTGSRVYVSSSNGTSAGSSLVVFGSGSTLPVFTVQGSQGELFSVTDSLSGSLFSVNDISGLPIIEAFSDNTILLGSYQAPALLTTYKTTLTSSGNFTLSSLPTASYDGAFYDYTARSGSNARAGTIVAMWSGTSVSYTETATSDFGSTTGLSLGVFISGANMVLTGSASTTAWTIKTIIRSI